MGSYRVFWRLPVQRLWGLEFRGIDRYLEERKGRSPMGQGQLPGIGIRNFASKHVINTRWGQNTICF